MRFLFTCGGTAGHINPALAVASALLDRIPGSEVMFIGAEGKMEMELVPREGYEIRSIPITNISRAHSLAGIRHNLDTVKNVLEKTPPELASDILERGIVLTGGGSLLRGLEELIEDRTQINTIRAEDPMTAVAIGTGKYVEFLSGYREMAG